MRELTKRKRLRRCQAQGKPWAEPRVESVAQDGRERLRPNRGFPADPWKTDEPTQNDPLRLAAVDLRGFTRCPRAPRETPVRTEPLPTLDKFASFAPG
jgi:hypothetical protein